MNLEHRPDYAVNWPRAVQSSVAILGALTFGAIAYGYGYGVSSGRTEVYPQAAVAAVAAFSDGFESGDLTATNSTFLGWSVNNGAGCDSTAVSTERAYAGSYSLVFAQAGVATDSDNRCEMRFSVDSLTAFAMEYQVWIDSAYTHRSQSGSVNNKFARIWSGDLVGDDYAAGIFSVTWEFERLTDTTSRSRRIAETKQTPTEASSTVDSLLIGRRSDNHLRANAWNKVVLCVQPASDSASSDGFDRITVNDSTVAGLENWNHWRTDFASTSAPTYITNGNIFGAANSGYTNATKFFIDDFKIYTSDITTVCPSPA